MTPQPSDEATALIPLIIADIYQLAGQLRRNADAIAQAIGQTQARWQVLSAASAEPKTVPQIARRLGIARQNVQRIADLLIEEGLAAVHPNPDHKTSPFLVLTSSGRAAFAQLMRHGRSYHRELANELAGHDLAALRRGLRRFCDALDRREAQLADSNQRGG
jgi:DNA-binding MarR family transcriptional regulator